MRTFIGIKITTIAALTATIALCSCGKVLDTKVYGQITPDSYFTSESDFETAVLGVQIYLSHRGCDNHDGLWSSHNLTYLALSLWSSDEIQPNFSGFCSTHDQFQFTATTDMGNIYDLNSFCAKITRLIEIFENNNVMSDTKADYYIAQLKATRYIYMYCIYDFFGPTNVKLNPRTLNDETQTPRLSEAEYLSAMNADYSYAINSTMEDRFEPGSPKWGRISKDVLRFFRMRQYMLLGEWAKAQSMCEYFLDNQAYSLADNYFDLFNVVTDGGGSDYSREVIFGCPSDASRGTIWPSEALPGGTVNLNGTWTTATGWNYLTMPWEHYHRLFPGAPNSLHDRDAGYNTNASTFEVECYRNDVRNKGILLERKNRAGKLYCEFPDPAADETNQGGAMPLKYLNYALYNTGGTDYPFETPALRLAEVKLNYAEVVARQGEVTERAIEQVSEVRQRAGLTGNLTLPEGIRAGCEVEDFLEFLFWERSRELYCEGQRRADQIRFGRFISRAIEQGKTDAQGREYMARFPIPNDVILQGNGIIKQNDGYITEYE